MKWIIIGLMICSLVLTGCTENNTWIGESKDICEQAGGVSSVTQGCSQGLHWPQCTETGLIKYDDCPIIACLPGENWNCNCGDDLCWTGEECVPITGEQHECHDDKDKEYIIDCCYQADHPNLNLAPGAAGLPDPSFGFCTCIGGKFDMQEQGNCIIGTTSISTWELFEKSCPDSTIAG